MPLEKERELGASRVSPRLADLAEPPRVLYVRGELPRGPGVAIVGTRRPTAAAARFARKLAGELAQAGVCILSGGAKGIDAAAHRGALAARGASVVVAPCGFDRPFPPEHARLYSDVIRKGGAFVSLQRADEPATYASFFARNAVLVALAHAVVVVEAPARSGARNAAAHARRLGRVLFAVPAVPWNWKGTGCILELQLGARALASPRDVLRALAAERAHAIALGFARPPALSRAPAPARARTVASDSTRRGRGGTDLKTQDRPMSQRAGLRSEPVVDAVRQGAKNADEICARTGLEPSAVQQRILTLTLEGVLVSDLAGGLKVVNI